MPKPVIWTIDDDPDVLRAVERDLRRRIVLRVSFHDPDRVVEHLAGEVDRQELGRVFLVDATDNHEDRILRCEVLLVIRNDVGGSNAIEFANRKEIAALVACADSKEFSLGELIKAEPGTRAPP